MKLKEPLFIGVQFLNTKSNQKKKPTISVRINLRSDDVIYVASSRSRMEVVAYEARKSSLFITDVEGVNGPNVYNLFRNEAVRYAREELDTFMKELQGLSQEEYEQKNYKDLNVLTNHLYEALEDRQDLYTDLQKQVSLIASRKLPRVNEYLVFQDDEKIKYPVTARVPYKNPANEELTKEQRKTVDSFLDVFLDPYNKKSLSWYLGAAIANLDIHDDRVSKLLILSSSKGGSGKSSLMGALAESLFTAHYRDIKDDFDSFFYTNNKFGVSALSTKRMSVYSEAAFMNTSYVRTDEDTKHDFSGMNVSTIKSLITEGFVSSEAKYGDREMEQLNGFHMVLTNHPPVINEDNEAMNRRILPIMIKPSRMSHKAKQLNLWGKTKFDEYVKKHSQAFANYFYTLFKEDEYAFSDVDYNHNDYIEDIDDAQSDYKDQKEKEIKKDRALAKEGVIRVLEQLEKEEEIDLSLFISDIQEVIDHQDDEGTTDKDYSDNSIDDIRLENGTLYVNSSKNFLLNYGNKANQLRNRLENVYGSTMRKFQRRMFIIPLTQHNKK